MTLSRRDVLRGGALLGAGAAVYPFGRRAFLSEASAQTPPTGVAFDAAPFTLGVSSGDPRAESVIISTRLAPEPLAGGGEVAEGTEVDWVVAADPRLRRVVATGTVPTTAAMGHSVHVDVTGLQPGTTYWYRFAARGRVSRIGRTRTAPPVGVDALRFAFVSCQDFPAGRYSAYANLAREDVDFVVHLGDYIYEGGGSGEGRSHLGDEVNSLESYRNRYALYRGDPQLRAAHAAFPWIVTWDDHEFDNNYADDIREDSDGPGEENREAFLQRRANAYQAYYEIMPIRLTEFGLPDGPDYRIYRRLVFGDLLDMSVLDTRQYRTDQPCSVPDGDQGQEMFFVARCEGQDDPNQTIMGEEQKSWLLRGLSDSQTAWRCIAQQLMVGQLNTASTSGSGLVVPGAGGESVYFNSDQWDGYRVERDELLGHIRDEEIPDVFVITGDIHSHWVHDLQVEFDDTSQPTVATEFVGTSISTSGFSGSTGAFRTDFYPNNPHLRYFEGDQHGYAIVDVTRDAVRTTYRVVGTNAQIEDPRRPVQTQAAFVLPRGDKLVAQVEGENENPR